MIRVNASSKIILCDFDDTLAIFEGVPPALPGKPLEGAIDYLSKFHEEGWQIHIFSGRANCPDGIGQIIDWLEQYQVPYDAVLRDKPDYEVIIDDAAISPKEHSWKAIYDKVTKGEVGIQSQFYPSLVNAPQNKWQTDSDVQIPTTFERSNDPDFFPYTNKQIDWNQVLPAITGTDQVEKDAGSAFKKGPIPVPPHDWKYINQWFLDYTFYSPKWIDTLRSEKQAYAIAMRLYEEYQAQQKPAKPVQLDLPGLTKEADRARDLALALGLTVAPIAVDSPTTAPQQIEQPFHSKVPVGWKHYEHLVYEAAAKHGVPVDMFYRLLRTENDIGNPTAVNHNTGATGLGQFMPETASELGINPKDPKASIDAAAKYLKSLYTQFGNWEDAVRAYNWGPGNVQKSIDTNIPNPRETEEYLAKVKPVESGLQPATTWDSREPFSPLFTSWELHTDDGLAWQQYSRQYKALRDGEYWSNLETIFKMLAEDSGEDPNFVYNVASRGSDYLVLNKKAQTSFYNEAQQVIEAIYHSLGQMNQMVNTAHKLVFNLSDDIIQVSDNDQEIEKQIVQTITKLEQLGSGTKPLVDSLNKLLKTKTTSSLEVEASAPGSKDFEFSSIQIPLPPELAQEVESWGRVHIPEDILCKEEGTQGREDYPHITVKYGINSEDPEEAIELLKPEAPVKYKLGKVSLFKNEDKPFDVVKVEIISPDLHRLNKKISENLKVTDTFPTYKPHVTIAYVQKGKADGLEGNTDFQGLGAEALQLEFSSKNKEKGATQIPLKVLGVTKTAQTYSDKEMDEITTRNREDSGDWFHDSPGGGFTPHDWNDSTTDYPQPKDIQYGHPLDQLVPPERRFDRWVTPPTAHPPDFLSQPFSSADEITDYDEEDNGRGMWKRAYKNLIELTRVRSLSTSDDFSEIKGEAGLLGEVVGWTAKAISHTGGTRLYQIDTKAIENLIDKANLTAAAKREQLEMVTDRIRDQIFAPQSSVAYVKTPTLDEVDQLLNKIPNLWWSKSTPQKANLKLDTVKDLLRRYHFDSSFFEVFSTGATGKYRWHQVGPSLLVIKQ